jgi:hypothetical protein
MFATGLGMYDASGGVDPMYANAIEAYFTGAALTERWIIAARRFYHGRLKRQRSQNAPSPAPVAPTAS